MSQSKYRTRQDKNGQWWVLVKGSLDGYPMPSKADAERLITRATFDPSFLDRMLAVGIPTQESWAE